MDKDHIEEAQDLYDEGHTFFAIVIQLKNWFTVQYTQDEVAKALGDIPNNPIGHAKFRS